MNELPDPTCLDCAAFRVERTGEDVPTSGRCRLRPELGRVPESMPACHVFQVKTSRADKVKLPERKAVAKTRSSTRTRTGTSQKPSKNTSDTPTLQNPTQGDVSGEINMDRDGLKQVLRELLTEETMYGFPEMGGRWQGGTLVMKPAEDDKQAKEVPLETFFHKIVMVRDKLRVLEAKLNSHNNLSEQDKVELQGYITKCYGSLTTFNILFQEKSDQFRSK
jgi:hypothetical protein